jgi:hypothetical protein
MPLLQEFAVGPLDDGVRGLGRHAKNLVGVLGSTSSDDEIVIVAARQSGRGELVLPGSDRAVPHLALLLDVEPDCPDVVAEAGVAITGDGVLLFVHTPADDGAGVVGVRVGVRATVLLAVGGGRREPPAVDAEPVLEFVPMSEILDASVTENFDVRSRAAGRVRSAQCGQSISPPVRSTLLCIVGLPRIVDELVQTSIVEVPGVVVLLEALEPLAEIGAGHVSAPFVGHSIPRVRRGDAPPCEILK